jgi:hypothetical protein
MLLTAKVGSKVNIRWVLRKSNGYFVDSSRTNDSVQRIRKDVPGEYIYMETQLTRLR